MNTIDHYVTLCRERVLTTSTVSPNLFHVINVPSGTWSPLNYTVSAPTSGFSGRCIQWYLQPRQIFALVSHSRTTCARLPVDYVKYLHVLTVPYMDFLFLDFASFKQIKIKRTLSKSFGNMTSMPAPDIISWIKVKKEKKKCQLESVCEINA